MKYKILTVLFAGSLFLASVTMGQTKIACVGNSITYGSGLTNRVADGYVGKVAAKLGNSYIVRNYGISARTLLKKGDYPYWNESAYSDLKNWLPNVVTIMLGTNDTKPHNWDAHKDEYRGDLEAMIEELKALSSNPKIFLCLPPAIGNNSFGIRSSVMQNEIIPIIKTVASEQQLEIIDVNTPFLANLNLMPDGVHPLIEGNKLMTDVFYEHIQNYLTRPNPLTRLLWYGIPPDALGETEADRPQLTIYLPDNATSSTPAILICPGGGYGNLAFAKEGTDVAEWLNEKGIAGIVLRYRFNPYRHPTPWNDVTRAMRIIRYYAQDWNLDTTKIGVLGFSAGGHLASTLGTHFDFGNENNEDPIEQQPSRPDFMALIYPVIDMYGPLTHQGSHNNLIGTNASDSLEQFLTSYLQVNENTPPVFLATGDADGVVPMENSVLMDSALQDNGIESELLIEPGKGHGYGLAGEWPEAFYNWFNSLYITPLGEPVFTNVKSMPNLGLSGGSKILVHHRDKTYDLKGSVLK